MAATGSPLRGSARLSGGWPAGPYNPGVESKAESRPLGAGRVRRTLGAARTHATALDHALLLCSTVAWGTLHPVSKRLLLEGFTPTQLALARLGLTALTMLAVALITGRFARLARRPRRELLAVAAIGFCGYFGSMVLSLNGLRYLPAATNALLANTSPLFVALFSAVFVLRAPPAGRALLGLLAGFAGVAVLSQGRPGGSEGAAIGVLLSLTASGTWALYTVLGRWATARLDAVLVTFLASAVSLPPLLIMALAEGRLDRLVTASPTAVAELLWLGFGTTGFAFLVWTAALRRLRAVSVAAYSYLIPVFGVLFALLLLGEQPTPLFVLGAALTLVGVAVAQR